MSDRNLIFTLAKVIIAAAWADGEITREETNSLKDLLFRLPHSVFEQAQLSGREWAELEIYMESPVDEAERARLVEELKAALRTPKDRSLAIEALEDLIQADGVVTEEEHAVVGKIKAALEAVDLSIIAQLGRLIAGPVQRRSAAVANAPNREVDLEDFIKNRVFYAVRQRLHLEDNADLPISETDLRKLSLAGGLMAQVAHADRDVTDQEFERMVDALQTGWDISHEAATLVVQVAISKVSANLDYYRLIREFASSTTVEERERFLEILFAVAAADGQISHAENEEIRTIATTLRLSHRQFIDAKIKVIDR